MKDENTRASVRPLSIPMGDLKTLDAMMREDGDDNFSGYVRKLLRPILDHWARTGQLLAPPDRVRALQEAQLAELEARMRLEEHAAKQLRRQLGRDPDALTTALAPAKRKVTVEEFLDEPGRVDQRETFLRQAAVRASLDPDAVVAGVSAARARARAREEADIRARVAERQRHQKALEARPR